MNKNSKNSKIEKTEIMETLTVNEPQMENVENTPQVEIIAPTVESLTEQIKNAKKTLNALNIEFDFDENNPHIAEIEMEISKLLAERKTLEKANEKLKLENEFNEKLNDAKNRLSQEFMVSLTELETIIERSKNPDAKSTLISDFGLVFGKKPLFIAENVSGSNLAKGNAKNIVNGEQKVNITKSVKDMLSAGNDAETIVNFILTNSDMDETKAKKRLNDIKWGWEIENGLREKPKK